MTTGDEEAEGLVDDLFRDVDDLEREYSETRQELDQTNPEMPTIEVPSVEVPNPEMPTIEVPSVEVPSVAVPSVEVPGTEALSAEAASIEVPSIEVPSIEVPSVEVPRIDVPGVVAPLTAELPPPPQMGAVTPAAPIADAALSIEVDDQFADLEREYTEARGELATTAPARIPSPSEALEASNERFELQSQVATLQAEVSRQGDELDERDRLLNELGDKISGFEAEIAQRESESVQLHAARQETLDERREQARLSALLDARVAERQELADVASRLQHDRDHIQDLLTTALERYDEAEARLAQMDDKVRHIEAERDTAAHEHEARAHELIESRAEMSKLADRLDGVAQGTAAADERAEKAEALAERRANEAGYLNRRITAMTEKLEAADSFEADANNLRRELNAAERRITELEREVATEQSEAAAARIAVDAIAARTSNYDELFEANEQLRKDNEQLREERDEAWKAASGAVPAPAAAAVPEPEPESAPSAEVASLAERAHELGARRTNDAAMAAEAAEAAAAEAAANRQATGEALEDLDAEDVSLIDSDLTALAPVNSAPAGETVPRVDIDLEGTGLSDAEIDAALLQAARAVAGDNAHFATPDVATPNVAPPAVAVPQVAAPAMSAPEVTTPAVSTPQVTAAFSEQRKRIILPANLEPNTPEAVAHLLNQPGVTAIVDARSTCGRTGIRPSELFERVAALRDFFDVPVEVVVTPVSTPVGGAPDLPAIGVHHITGADTVADRVRALCMGFPVDQPLVVIAGDDHVRRAAIGEEANVVEPAAVLNLSTT